MNSELHKDEKQDMEVKSCNDVFKKHTIFLKYDTGLSKKVVLSNGTNIFEL